MKKLFTLFAVAAMAFAAQATELTVCDGTDTNTGVPIYGLYTDVYGTLGQMIYTPAMLEGMEGAQISQVKFYSPGINFSGVTLRLSMKDGVEQDNFADYNNITDLMAVAETMPNEGDTELVFNLAQPFTYEGGNLVLEVQVIETQGDWGTTEFYGMNLDYAASYYQYWYSWSDTPSRWTASFLPKATFTFEGGSVTPPVEPTEKTQTPDGMYQVVPGQHEVLVTITGYEGDVFYRVIYTDAAGNVTEGEWTPYVDAFSVYEDGRYRVEFYAVAQGKLPSDLGAVEFTVSPMTGIEEMNASKEVAAVRYFNMAGQEMTQPAGMTIVVTSYTDGTTSSAKVVK